MKRLSLSLIMILNLLSTAVWGEDFLVNYYHKGVVVHTKQVAKGEAIGPLPELNLASCDNEINIFVGWIAENDIANYQTANTTTPTFITENYIPTSNTNLYALFADGEATTDLLWQQVKSNTELQDNDQIIIAANGYNYAIGKTLNKDNRLNTIEITKNADKSIITPNDDVQIFTLKKISNLLWGLQTENGYLCNTNKENTINTITEIKTWSSWSFQFYATTRAVGILNEYTSWSRYLYFNNNSQYFACKKSSISNLAIYKQSPSRKINYITCTTPDAIEYTITLHEGNNISEIKCMSDKSITQPTPNQNFNHYQFYGWTTTPIDKTLTTPEIITFPYTPTSNIDLYAVYSNTTADCLTMTDKTIPAYWEVNETLITDNKIALLKDNYIKIPYIKEITQVDVRMQQISNGISTNQHLNIQTDNKEVYFISPTITNTLKTYSFTFDTLLSTSLTMSSLLNYDEAGILVESITIHKEKTYTTAPINKEYITLSFNANGGNENIKTYNIKQEKGGNITLPNNIFTYDNKNFIEWNTKTDGSGEAFDDGSIIKNINENKTLYAQWGKIIKIASNENLEIDTSTSIDKLIIECDNYGNTGEINFTNNTDLTISKDISFKKIIDNSHFHFFSLPFDCNITDIEVKDTKGNLLTYAPNSTIGDWVIYHYDQTLASKNAGDTTTNAWVELLGTEHTLKANRGYIIGYFSKDKTVTVKFKSANHQFITTPNTKTLDFGTEYQWYTEGPKQSACGWNLIGSPYYGTATQGNLTQFVTIPNADGKTYTQCLYSEALEQELIRPFSSFFIQLNQNIAPTITTNIIDYTLFNNTVETITITLTNNGNQDKTTIINDNTNSKEYEIGKDLKKWIGYANLPQIYTIENEIPFAYNSQKIDESTQLLLGVYSPIEGEYTFATKDNYSDVFLVDKKTNIITNLAKSNYTTWLSQGTNNHRFEICFQKTASTEQIINNSNIEYFIHNGTVWIKNLPQNAIIYIYDYTGKIIDKSTSDHYFLPTKGLYHIIIVENDIKIYNFDAIY